jgi:hypothetical protein
VVCSTSFTTAFPRWEINSEVYQITDLPFGYVASGMNITFSVHENLTVIRCSFLRVIDLKIVEIFSNFGTVSLGVPAGLCVATTFAHFTDLFLSCVTYNYTCRTYYDV